jgi:hypothetical protein
LVTLATFNFDDGKVGASKIKTTVFTEAVNAKADRTYLIQALTGDSKAYGDAWHDASLLGPEDMVFASPNMLTPSEWFAWFGIVQAKAVSDDSSNVKSTEYRALHAS